MTNNKYKILLVEDEANIQTFVTALLEANGYQVVSAESCQSAKTMYSSHIPDLVILDLVNFTQKKKYHYKGLNLTQNVKDVVILLQ